MTIDELHGIFTAYEMRTKQNEPLRNEAEFKVSKEPENSIIPSKIHSDNSDGEEALFIKKLERGTRKYKGNLPLKCFNCEIIRHFSSKCPFPKQYYSDGREASKKFKKGNIRKKRRNLMRRRRSFTPWKIVKMKTWVVMSKNELYS